MTSEKRDFLLHRLDETRSKIEALLPKIDIRKEIYPGWTIKEILAHMTGWDDAVIDSLQAHVLGHPPSIPAIRSLDEYNERTVSSRQELDYDQILKEWHLTRQELCTFIKKMAEDKFLEPLIVPWGEKVTVTHLVDIFRGHEEAHTQDVIEWLKQPEEQPGKDGK
jgi:hypothetical protein